MLLPARKSDCLKIWRLSPLLVLLWCSGAAADPERDMARGSLAYERGDVVDAIARFRKAAIQGHTPAQIRLAYILDKAEQDSEAVKWYRQAAEQGSAEGQYGLGQMYLNGEGVERDYEQGISWITKAAENGLTAAMRTLALNYERGSIGLPQDTEKMRFWLRRLAEHGDHWAKQRLARE